jgi:ATP-dependent DNA helicase RecG
LVKILSPPILVEASLENRNKAFQIEVEYSSSEGISSAKIKSFISLALELLGKRFHNSTDWLDAEVATRYKWPPLISAIVQVHNPLTLEDLHPQSPAHQRIAFEELTSTILRLRLENRLADVGVGQNFSIICPKNWVNILRERILDFNMTQCQLNAIQRIQSDLESNMRMVRLLQGDVGTGKTIVAAHAILHVAESGKLCVVLAPTEILAEQHYAILSRYFKILKSISQSENYSSPINNQSVVLLLGGSKIEARRELFMGIKNGSVKVIVGTHALLSDELIQILQNTSRLGLAVIDEEQRFGVNQRDKLAKLSNVLFTTATPIPRSLSLVNISPSFPPPSSTHIVLVNMQ